MNDDRLNREIEEALAVEPSPQFAAHVRARIAERRRPTRFWHRWSVAAAAGSAAAAIVTLMFFEPQQTGISKPHKVAEAHVEVTENSTPSTPQPKAAAVLQAAVPAPPKEPEVLIDPREVAAFRKFVEGVQEDRIDLAKLIELQRADAKAVPIEEIALMPIGDLEPIVIESLAFGVRRIEGGSL